MRVLVIGAGIGGLALAQGLRNAGIDVDVYERDSAITARFQGYRIGLDENGLAALRGCLPGCWHPLVDATTGVLSGERRVVNAQLEETSLWTPAEGIATDRHVLRHLLLTGLDGQVHTGRRLVGYEVLTGGAVRATFADGTNATADLLVGADGINSAVRAQLSPDTVPEDTGTRFVIGRTPLEERFTGLVPGFGTAVSHEGRTLMLGTMRFRSPPARVAAEFDGVALPDIGDYLRWVLIPRPGELDTVSDSASAQETTLRAINGWHPLLRELIEAADPDNSTVLSIRVVRPGRRWPAGTVTLLGDAIHATSPSGGNGAVTALRDADLLRRKLIDAHDGRTGLAEAIDGYEQQMFAEGAAAVEYSVRALEKFVPPAGLSR